jgi:hypothetical protein
LGIRWIELFGCTEEMSMELTLQATTRKGKNVLARARTKNAAWGGLWRVLSEADRVHFAAGKRGPWYLVQPVFADIGARDLCRWVHATQDDDFIVQPNA